MPAVFIGIGSNLGDRKVNIKRAINYLNACGDITVEKISGLIETEPQGGPVQGKYLNGAVKINTLLTARDLLKVLRSIEDKMGRVRTLRNGPRTIDLDILLYGKQVINEPDLKVPHPRMFERKFVLEPLFEIEPGIVRNMKEAI